MAIAQFFPVTWTRDQPARRLAASGERRKKKHWALGCVFLQSCDGDFHALVNDGLAQESEPKILREAKVVGNPKQAPPPSMVPGGSVGLHNNGQAPGTYSSSIGLDTNFAQEGKVEIDMNQPIRGCPELASIVLAGGEGQRLRSLTAEICGTEMPKQFCPVLGTETLLEQTLNRVGLAIPPRRTVTVLTRAHQTFYCPLLEGTPPQQLAVQPEKRGTTAAIMYGLEKIAAIDPRAIVAIFPSDHYCSDDQRLMHQVAIAARSAWQMPDKLVLLSVSPDGLDISCGWMQLGAILPFFDSVPIHAVRGFRKKPTSDIARYLHRSGALLNTFAVVAQLQALMALFRSIKPDLYSAFEAISSTMNTCLEAVSVEKVYKSLPASDFSRDVLTKAAANLAALPVTDLEWSDLGEPRRVHFVVRAEHFV